MGAAKALWIEFLHHHANYYGTPENSSRTPEAKTNASKFDGDVLKAAQSRPTKNPLPTKCTRPNNRS